MNARMPQAILVICAVILTIICAVTFADRFLSKPTTYPVACADIPESNERLAIVRDGQVECHYKITRVKGQHNAR